MIKFAKPTPQLKMGWGDVDDAVDVLHDKLVHDFNINEPTIILGVKRGGLIPAVMLSHCLSSKLSVIDYQTRDSDDVMPLFNKEDIEKFTNIIVVDDLYDSGKTMDTIRDILEKTFPYHEIGYYVLVVNDDLEADYITHPDLIIKPKSQWIVFPWE